MGYTENILIRKAQRGSKEAFRELVVKYDLQVLRMAMSYRNSEEDAQDIYQEVFLRVYKNLGSFKFNSEFSTWLFRITTNVCISYYDKKKRRSHDSLDSPIIIGEEEVGKVSDLISGDDNTSEHAERNEMKESIREAMNELPEKQRMAFGLKYIEGYKIKEIAEMMDSKEGTIKRYLFTSVRKMQEKLKNLIEH